jgi:hypothetical protein
MENKYKMIKDENSNKLFLKNEEWGEGEWLKEPGINELVEFEHKGFKCYLMRQDHGAWCGYVAIPLNHKYVHPDAYNSLNVHGGITWYDPYLPWHTQRPDTWFYLGFDCLHYEDYVPAMEKKMEYLNKIIPQLKEIEDKYKNLIGDKPKKIYRTMDFAKNELMKLVDQIIEAENCGNE